MKKKQVFFISAGEHSGDMLAAELYGQLKSRMPRSEAFGITGEGMTGAGIESIASIDEFGFMGFVEIIKKLSYLLELEARILCEIERRHVDVAILVDFPGFHFRLAEQLRLRGVRVIQYVAPKLWAWGAKRASRLRRDFDLVLGILPFEESFFLSRGVPYRYIGNPQKDRVEKIAVTRQALGLDPFAKTVVCLPGSRLDEIRRMFPIIFSVIAEMRKSRREIEFIVPIAGNLGVDDYLPILRDIDASEGLTEVGGDSLPGWMWKSIRFVSGMSLELMATADAAIVTSGTATLECALLGTPLTVVYAMSDMTYEIARTKVTISDFSLVNLMAQDRWVSEYIQHIEPRKVAEEMLALIADNSIQAHDMRAKFASMKRSLAGHAAWHGAEIIDEFLEKRSVALL